MFTFPVPVRWLGLSVSGKDMRYVFLYLPFEETSILGFKSKTVCSVSCKELNQAPGINRKKDVLWSSVSLQGSTGATDWLKL